MYKVDKNLTDRLIDWVRAYFDSVKGYAVIGISGGKDSTVAAALIARAIGADRVLGVLMPSGVQPDKDVALEVCKRLGIRHIEVNIKDSVDALTAQLSQQGIELNSTLLINTPPRIRMATLYAVCASVGGRVVNTGNLSEEYVGYSTKFGDGAGDFAPLKNLTCTEVVALGRLLGIDERLVGKEPSDGLSGLTDEQNLGFTYEVLDKYIRTGIIEDVKIKERIDYLNKINRHKSQPIVKPSF